MGYTTILEFLQGVKSLVTTTDIKRAGFTNVRTELRKLERQGLITKVENHAKNTAKKYMNAEGKFYTYEGTRFYTYQVV